MLRSIRTPLALNQHDSSSSGSVLWCCKSEMLKVREALFIQCIYPENTNHCVYIFFIIKNFFTLFMKAKQNILLLLIGFFCAVTRPLSDKQCSCCLWEERIYTDWKNPTDLTTSFHFVCRFPLSMLVTTTVVFMYIEDNKGESLCASVNWTK